MRARENSTGGNFGAGKFKVGKRGAVNDEEGSSITKSLRVLLCAIVKGVKEPIPNTMSSAETSIWLLVFYFWIGSFFYCNVYQGWSTIDSVFFLSGTMTTVGYGDQVPTTKASKIFTIFWVLFGVCVVAVGLVEIATAIMNARELLMKKTRAALLAAASGSGGEVNPEVAEKLAAIKARKAAADGTNSGNPVAWLFAAHPFLWSLCYLTAFLAGSAVIVAELEGWTLIDAFYFSVVTGTSIGYGDVVPETVLGRLLGAAYVPLAVVFTSTQLSELADALLGGAAGDSKLDKLLSADLSIEGLLAMDQDGDGEITEFEFLRFMLTSAGLADADLLDSLHDRFTAMDADGSGSLTKDDIPRAEPLGPPRPQGLAAARVVAAKAAWASEPEARAVLRDITMLGKAWPPPLPPPKPPPLTAAKAAMAKPPKHPAHNPYAAGQQLLRKELASAPATAPALPPASAPASAPVSASPRIGAGIGSAAAYRSAGGGPPPLPRPVAGSSSGARSGSGSILAAAPAPGGSGTPPAPRAATRTRAAKAASSRSSSRGGSRPPAAEKASIESSSSSSSSSIRPSLCDNRSDGGSGGSGSGGGGGGEDGHAPLPVPGRASPPRRTPGPPSRAVSHVSGGRGMRDARGKGQTGPNDPMPRVELI